MDLCECVCFWLTPRAQETMQHHLRLVLYDGLCEWNTRRNTAVAGAQLTDAALAERTQQLIDSVVDSARQYVLPETVRYCCRSALLLIIDSVSVFFFCVFA